MVLASSSLHYLAQPLLKQREVKFDHGPRPPWCPGDTILAFLWNISLLRYYFPFQLKMSKPSSSSVDLRNILTAFASENKEIILWLFASLFLRENEMRGRNI
jgi:hypothetical protein